MDNKMDFIRGVLTELADINPEPGKKTGKRVASSHGVILICHSVANWAAEIRIRAEHKLGEMLKAQKAADLMNRGTAGQGRPSLGTAPGVVPKNTTSKLSEIGISHKMSSRAQKIAEVPADEFEAVIEKQARVVSRKEVAVAIKEYEDLNRLVEGEKLQGGRPLKNSPQCGTFWTQQKTADDLGISNVEVVSAIKEYLY